MDYRRKKRALSHYRKANKKHFLLASGVTMMAFSTGIYTTQVAKADQTATTTQVQQQTAETTQATTEAKTDLTLTTENSSQKTATENEVQAETGAVVTTEATENTQLQDTEKNKVTDTTQTVETKTEPTETETKKQENVETQLTDKVQTTVQTGAQDTQTTTQPATSNEVTATQATATENKLAVQKADSTQNIANNIAVSFAAVPTPDHFNIGDSSYTRADAIDVSSYQDWLTQDDFNKLKQLGIKTAIVKVTQGTGYVNPAASKQIEYARNAGLNVMVYHYAMFDNTSAGYAEGQHTANTMQNFGLSKDTLIFADMEDSSTYSVNAQANLNSFWNALSVAGFTNHAVYTGGSYLYRDAVIATVGRDRTWIAQYPYTPVRGGHYEQQWHNAGYGAWQFASTAYIPGREYMGPLDVSIDFNGLLTAPVKNREAGYFDEITLKGNDLSIRGWHAADLSASRGHAYVIVYDKTAGKELRRVAYTPTYRQDVANSYAKNIYNAANSGFNVNFSLAGIDISGHELQFIARYSDAANGEGNHTDMWSKGYVLLKNEVGNFDEVKVVGDQLHVRGWHATDRDLNGVTSNLQLIDNQTGRVLRTVNYSAVARPDVVKNGYASYKNAANSGFDVYIPLSGVDITNIKVIANYGSIATLSSREYHFDREADYFDDISIRNGNQLHVSGWHAADKATTRPYTFLIVFDKTAGRELAQVSYTALNRNDVANSFAGGIYQAGKSGFDTVISLGNADITEHELQVVARYSDATSGEGNRTDAWSRPLVVAKRDTGFFDEVRLVNDKLHVRGWHASDRVSANTVANIEAIDTKTGRVLRSVAYTPDLRPDVAKNGYASYKNATTSGFDVYIPVAGLDISNITLVANYTTSGYTTKITSNNRNFERNDGYLDRFYVDGNNVAHVSGWHAADKATTRPYAFIIIYDQTTKKELGRAQYTASARQDVLNSYAGGTYNAGKSGFNNVAIELGKNIIKGHDLQVITRYTDDPRGNGNYLDIWFPSVRI